MSELNYLSQIVIMVYEDKTKPPDSADRFHVELYFSPGNYSVMVERSLELADSRAAAAAPSQAASMSPEGTPPPLHSTHNVRPIYEQAIIESDQLEDPSPLPSPSVTPAQQHQQQQQQEQEQEHAESEIESHPPTSSSGTRERPTLRVSIATPIRSESAIFVRQSSLTISSSLPDDPAGAEYLHRSPVSSPPPEAHRCAHAHRSGHSHNFSDTKRCNLLPPCTVLVSS